MNKDLKIIKKYYGEAMMHFCRDAFPTILEKEGTLSQFLLEHFEPNHELYNDIIKHKLQKNFKIYIYSLATEEDNNKEVKTNKTPKELFDEAGYTLYECKCEEDIQSFKKYYAFDEELCTFRDNRLFNCYVFFAVKKNVDEIKREDFKNPERQDLYGTSVISIQFTKNDNHILSIKNRYNHTVANPDATFSNNLDNIIPGLTDSFAKFYKIVQNQNQKSNFEIPSYIKVLDKYYKYNMERNNIYCCPNNIIIDNFEVKRLEKEKYILLDYFILDLERKEIYPYKRFLYKFTDSFIDGLGNIKDIKIEKSKKGRTIYITPNAGEIIEIKIDKENNIVGYKNNNIINIDKNFLLYNKKIKQLELNNVQTIETNFLIDNQELEKLELPSVIEIKSGFLYQNKILSSLNCPKLQIIHDTFLIRNDNLEELILPSAKTIGYGFLNLNQILKKLICPNVESIGGYALFANDTLEELILPNVKKIDEHFLSTNFVLKKFSAPNLEYLGNLSFQLNCYLEEFNVPNLTSIGEKVLDKHPHIDINEIVCQNKKRIREKK